MIEKVEKAYLVEIENYTTDATQKEEGSNKVEVQFNPENLKLTYSNQNTGGAQPNGETAQNIGHLTSQLALELLFDTTESGSDVREKTQQVAHFLMPKDGDGNLAPPRTRFQWGSFIFEGIVDALTETLEYFSAEGLPMRAAISLTIKSDNIVFLIDKMKGSGGRPSMQGVGITSPLKSARPGESIQSLVGRSGKSADWKNIAQANGLEDPLRLAAGTLINLSKG